MRRIITTTAALVALAAVIPAAAMAVEYPPPTNPGSAQPKPKGPFKTLKVCPKMTKKAKKAGCKYTIVQKAVDAAKPGDTVKLADGTYGEGVIVWGKAKRYVKIIGNEKKPTKVVFDGAKIPTKIKYKTTQKVSKSEKVDNSYPAQVSNAILVNGANHAILSGMSAKHYKGNCFFVDNNGDGFTMKNLVADFCGTYGIYVFNSVGGTITKSSASNNNDGGFYIGQTPPQEKPKYTQVSKIYSHTNILGWSGTNMRYVVIKKSFFYNNGAGIVPNALESEKYYPPEDNVITDNDVFNNNFDYYVGAPFVTRKTAAGSIPFPVGVGILLFGGRRDRVEGNRVYGNKLNGIGALQGLVVPSPDDTLVGNRITGNTLGNGGANPNGVDLFYDGNGTGNCIKDNVGVKTTLPASGAPFQTGCASDTAVNGFDQSAQTTALGWVAGDDHEAHWSTAPQAAVKDPLTGKTLEKRERYVNGAWEK